MADVTATETGSKRTLVTVVDGRYIVDLPLGYRLVFNTAVSPFPVVPTGIEITAVSPSPMAVGTDPAVILTGHGFTDWFSSPGAGIAVKDGALENGVPGFVLNSDVQITIPYGTVPAIEAMMGSMTDCVIVLRSDNYPEVVSPPFSVQTSITVELISPQTATPVSDPEFFLLGSGFMTVGVSALKVQVDPGVQGEGLGTWDVQSDNVLGIPTNVVGRAVSAASLIGWVPPFEAWIAVYPVGGGSQVDSPKFSVINPATHNISAVSPSSVSETDPPTSTQVFTITGAGFADGIWPLSIKAAKNSPYSQELTGELAFFILDPTHIQVFGVMAALAALPSAMDPPFEFSLHAYRGNAISDQVSVTAPLDPMADAQFLAYTGGAGTHPLNVAGRDLAYLWDGLSAGMVTPVPITVPTPIYAYSFAVWIRNNSAFGMTDFAQATLSISDTFQLYNGALQSIIANLSTDSVASASGLIPVPGGGTWYLCVLTRESVGGNMKLFVNGAKVGEEACTINITMDHPSQSMPVGNLETYGTAAFWNRALSEAEVLDLFNQTSFPI